MLCKAKSVQHKCCYLVERLKLDEGFGASPESSVRTACQREDAVDVLHLQDIFILPQVERRLHSSIHIACTRVIIIHNLFLGLLQLPNYPL